MKQKEIIKLTTLRIHRKKWILTFEERYFEQVSNNPHDKGLTIYYQAPESSQNHKFIEFKTSHIDLTLSEDNLLKDMAKNTRYQINRFNKKDKLNCQIIEKPNIERIDTFASFYNSFAEMKKLKMCNTKKIGLLAKKSAIVFSIVKNQDMKPLCYHAYIVNGERARQLHSVTQFRGIKDKTERNTIARANRGLHWFDMKYFKSDGYKILDMGGLADLDLYPEMVNINNFKKEFGGKEIIEYNIYCPNSVLGRFAIYFLQKNNKIARLND
jgi:hypothetical protein